MQKVKDYSAHNLPRSGTTVEVNDNEIEDIRFNVTFKYYDHDKDLYYCHHLEDHTILRAYKEVYPAPDEEPELNILDKVRSKITGKVGHVVCIRHSFANPYEVMIGDGSYDDGYALYRFNRNALELIDTGYKISKIQ